MNGFSFLNELNTKSNFVIVINSFFHLFFIYYISPGTRAPTFKELTFCVIEMKNTSYRYNCYTWIIREALIWGYHTVFWKYRGNWLTAQEGNIYLTKKNDIWVGFWHMNIISRGKESDKSVYCHGLTLISGNISYHSLFLLKK